MRSKRSESFKNSTSVVSNIYVYIYIYIYKGYKNTLYFHEHFVWLSSRRYDQKQSGEKLRATSLSFESLHNEIREKATEKYHTKKGSVVSHWIYIYMKI